MRPSLLNLLTIESRIDTKSFFKIHVFLEPEISYKVVSYDKE